jgi:hypothetical protein
VDVWHLDQFGAALRFGALASGVVLVVALVRRGRGRGGPFQGAGVLIAAGGLWGITDSRPVPLAVVLGVVGTGAVAGLASVRPIPLWCSLSLALPFGWAIGFRGDVVAPGWEQLLVAIAASAGGLLAAAFDHAWREQGLGITLLVVTAVGIYTTVPDTEAALAVLGVALPFLALGWPLRVASLGCAGSATAVATLMWAGSVGARGRPASIVGVVACLGLLVATPLGGLLRPRAVAILRRASAQAVVLTLLAAHVVVVIAAARIVGRFSDPALAVVTGTVLGLAAMLIGARFRPSAFSGVS